MNGDDVLRAVASKTGVVSMLTISTQMLSDEWIRGFAIDGVAPTRKDILSGTQRFVVRCSSSTTKETLTPAIRAFLDYGYRTASPSSSSSPTGG